MIIAVRYLALNGFRHSLGRYFTDGVELAERFNWTEKSAIRLAQTIREPTTLIGFSDGATAALTVANHSPHVRRVIAHSPMFRDEPTRTIAQIYLFRTEGDTTPTYQATEAVFRHLLQSDDSSDENGPGWGLHLCTIDPLPPLPVRDAATAVMRRRNHQFHNALPLIARYDLIPRDLIRPEFLTASRPQPTRSA